MESCNEVPLSVTLNKFAVPFKILVPVKVAVPAEAVKLPLTSNTDDIVKLEAVVTLPGILKLKKLSVPVDEIVLEAPFIVTFPADAVKLALVLIVVFPETTKSAVVLIVPETIRLLKIMPVPVIVFAAPESVIAPPAVWVNVPIPDVARLPKTVSAAAAVAETFAPDTVRLLKLCVPVPPIMALAPARVMVPVLPVKVPLFVQLPATVCAKAPAVKVVPAPISTKPPNVTLEAAV